MILILSLFISTAIARQPSQRQVCINVCVIDVATWSYSDCEILHATAIDGQVNNLIVPAGKIVAGEIECDLSSEKIQKRSRDE